MAGQDTENSTETWITGIGLASSLGEGVEANWDALVNGDIKADTTTFAPFVVHPLAPVNFDKQIAKKGDQRQMEPGSGSAPMRQVWRWKSAGIKGNAEILGKTDMIVAAGGGERDLARRQRDHDRAQPRATPIRRYSTAG